MLPAMWRIEACMNIAVNTVSQAGIVPGSEPWTQPMPVCEAAGTTRAMLARVSQRERDRAVLDDLLLGVGTADERAPMPDRQVSRRRS